MSGIFKGDSIYKSGGGSGGGYKDGGQLVDGDFIKVENNTFSTYENVNRNDLYFYIDDNGDVLNSVVNFTTQVNSNIHVYIVKNGLFIPLGNIGGNTVSAGNEYNLNITGNSFNIENITPSANVPEFVDIKGGIYSVAKFGSQLVMLQDLKATFKNIVNYTGADSDFINKPTYGYNTVTLNGEYFYRINDDSSTSSQVVKNELEEYFSPWRLPKTTDYFVNDLNASEKAKFNATINGYILCSNNSELSINNPRRDNAAMAYGAFYPVGGGIMYCLQNISPINSFALNKTRLVRLRLVMDL